MVFGRTLNSKIAFLFAALALAAPLSSCSKLFGRLPASEKRTTVIFGSGSGATGKASGRVVNTTATQNGGVFIWGVSGSANGNKVALFFNDESGSATKSLTNGYWTFYAAGWDGSYRFEGTMRCGSTTANLNGADVKVVIPISTSGCSDPFFGSSAYQSGGAPMPVRLVTCLDFSGVTDGTSTCGPPHRGDLRSFRLKLVSYENTALSGTPTIAGAMESRCYDLPSVGSGNSYVDTLVKIPAGIAGSPIYAVAVGYDTAGCTGGTAEYQFANSFLGGAANARVGNHPTAPATTLFLRYGVSPTPVVSGVTVVRNGITLTPPYAVDVGDTVTISVNASDPHSLPLSYVFHLFRNCGLSSTLQ